MADYKKLSDSRVGFSLKVSAEDFERGKVGAVEYFRQNLSLKGFRKGHIPDDVILKTVGVTHISNEAANRALTFKYREFVEKNDLNPVKSPTVSDFGHEKFPVDVKVEVEIYPLIDLGKYQKLKIEPVEVKITEKEIDDVIQTLIAKQWAGKKVDRAAKNGDQVVLDFVGKDKDGNVIPKADGKDFRIRLGVGHFIPEFEKAVIGMKGGDEKKSVPVKFPKDYSAAELAGNKIKFDIACRDVWEISLSDLTEEVVENIVGQKKTVEEFRKDVESFIRQNREKEENNKALEKYKEKLVKTVRMELPKSWVENEVGSRFKKLEQDPVFREDPEAFWEKLGSSKKQLEKEFLKQSVYNLNVFLALNQIL